MWYLLFAIVSASLLGSLHCVGMCGPLAILASGAGAGVPRRRVALSTGLYHLGRLNTYLLAGSLGGYLGSLVDIGGEMIGWQVTAARLVGLAMVVIGAAKLWSRWYVKPAVGQPKPSLVAGALVRLRPLLAKRSPTVRAYGIGFLTTFLPCGWLYLFALVAAATGSAAMGALVMFAFWIGTLPALTSLIAGAGWLSKRSAGFVPITTAVLLMLTGCFTFTGRGFAAMDSLESLRGAALTAPLDAATQQLAPAADPAALLEHVHGVGEVELPCCRAAREAAEALAAEEANE
ncbi:sulfite exporter TauE/SafE family protein [Roseimaritima ulvae]|uniref:sulfite exporter TauE/SafE family protein n=1 Tax=Roseimaritima ulvae TaxID=980254 RepID=UPI00083171F4|nr:sulfite exporter TauE/SafE family protein [Roseimaritima ulvae]